MYPNENTPSPNKLIKWGLASFVGLITLIAVIWAVDPVEAGSVKVVTSFGGVTGRVLQPGLNIITPFVESTRQINTRYLIYETMRESDKEKSQSDYKDGAVDTNTKDGQSVNVFYTIRFSVDSTKAVWVVERFGTEPALVDKIVRAESRSVARTVPSNFSAEELYVGTGKEKIAQLIADGIKQKLADSGIILDSVLVREVEFNNAYTQSIESKQIEAVKVQTAENIAARAVFEKQATISNAEAQAEAQRLQSLTITQQYANLEWIKKWDGKLPQYMTGESQLLLQLPR